MLLDATPGGPASNSYATVAEADAYHATHLYASAWTAASTSNKEAALIWATRLLDEQVDWAGGQASTTQALRWPRLGVYDYDGNEFPSNAIPAWLQHATAELARMLLGEDRTAERVIGLSSVRAGEVSVDFDRHDVKPILPPAVRSLIQRYGRLIGPGTGTASLVRV